MIQLLLPCPLRPFDPNVFTSSSGDYAGRLARFSASTGELRPVEDHLLPSEMVEWGEIPPDLEVLTTEESKYRDPGQTHSPIDRTRTEITVLPEVGCGCDNLPTSRRTSIRRLWQPPGGGDGDGDGGLSFPDGTSLVDTPLPPPIQTPNTPHLDTETTFRYPPGPGVGGEDVERRIRVNLKVLPRECKLRGEIVVVKVRERYGDMRDRKKNQNKKSVANNFLLASFGFRHESIISHTHSHLGEKDLEHKLRCRLVLKGRIDVLLPYLHDWVEELLRHVAPTPKQTPRGQLAPLLRGKLQD